MALRRPCGFWNICPSFRLLYNEDVSDRRSTYDLSGGSSTRHPTAKSRQSRYRVRNVNYDPANVVELWSTPGAVMVIEFADDEMVADVAASDSHTLKAEPRGNYLFFKFEGCLIPEPVIVLTKLPSGKLRRYALQVETHPQICSSSTARPLSKRPRMAIRRRRRKT